MSRFILSVEANQSIKDIFRYTRQQWGRQQAIDYVAALKRIMDLLAKKQISGRKREEIAPHLYSYPEGKHIIFYRITPSGIYIVHILHQQMDFPQHLTP